MLLFSLVRPEILREIRWFWWLKALWAFKCLQSIVKTLLTCLLGRKFVHLFVTGAWWTWGLDANSVLFFLPRGAVLDLKLRFIRYLDLCSGKWLIDTVVIIEDDHIDVLSILRVASHLLRYFSQGKFSRTLLTWLQRALSLIAVAASCSWLDRIIIDDAKCAIGLSFIVLCGNLALSRRLVHSQNSSVFALGFDLRLKLGRRGDVLRDMNFTVLVTLHLLVLLVHDLVKHLYSHLLLPALLVLRALPAILLSQTPLLLAKTNKRRVLLIRLLRFSEDILNECPTLQRLF